jgi:hypothetical protein
VTPRWIHEGRDDWKGAVKSALDQEFPSDPRMRTFAESSFSQIVGLLLKSKDVIHIYCDSRGEMTLHTGDD